MGAVSMSEPRRLEPVGHDFRRMETVSHEVRETQLPVFAPEAAPGRRVSLRSEAPEQLQVVAALLWQSWLILAGTVVGLTALMILVRLAVATVRWAL